MAKKRKPPAGALVLYDAIKRVELQGDLIFIEASSGAHIERGWMQPKTAMELHHRLGLMLEEIRTRQTFIRLMKEREAV